MLEMHGGLKSESIGCAMGAGIMEYLARDNAGALRGIRIGKHDALDSSCLTALLIGYLLTVKQVKHH